MADKTESEERKIMAEQSVADLKKQLAEMEAKHAEATAKNEELVKAAAAKLPPPLDPDVRWRVAAGLSLQQAIDASAAQKEWDNNPANPAFKKNPFADL